MDLAHRDLHPRRAALRPCARSPASARPGAGVAAPRHRRAPRCRSPPRPAGFAAASSTAVTRSADGGLGARCRNGSASTMPARSMRLRGVSSATASWTSRRPRAGPRARVHAPDELTARSATLPRAMPTTVERSAASAALPANDPSIFELDLRGLRGRWADSAALTAISGEAMTGTDRRAQALGVPEERLMEHAGTAVAAAVRALAVDLDRWGTGPIVILCGPGNNGGDGYVAARRLALAGASVVVGLVAPDARPTGGDGRSQLGPDRARHRDRQGPPAGRPRRRDVRARHREGRGHRRRTARDGRPRRPSRADPHRGRGDRPGARRPASRSSPSTRRPPSTSRAASRRTRRSGPT